MENSPLNRLPAELLNQVMEYSVTDEDDISITPPRTGSKQKVAVRLPKCVKALIAPTLVCKQMNADYTQLFYAVNSFQFHQRFDENQRIVDEFKILGSFIKAIGPRNSNALRSITVSRVIAFKPYDKQIDDILKAILRLRSAGLHPQCSLKLGFAVTPVIPALCFVLDLRPGVFEASRKKALDYIRQRQAVTTYTPFSAMLQHWERILASDLRTLIVQKIDADINAARRGVFTGLFMILALVVFVYQGVGRALSKEEVLAGRR